MSWDDILHAREVWLGKRASDVAWPECGIAIEGDFAGIQQYVLKPVPGAGGAAKRLRGRSLQVSALTELIGVETLKKFDGTMFYSAGGRFLMFAVESAGWRERLSELQKLLDDWVGKQFRGEVAFHLAGAEFRDGKIPRDDLGRYAGRRKNRSLEHYLQNGDGWLEAAFLREPMPTRSPFCCPACLTTAENGVPVAEDDEQKICQECDADRLLGEKLANSRDARLKPDKNGEIGFLDDRYTLGAGGRPLNVIHHMPRGKKPDEQFEHVFDLEEVAECSIGSRKFLAYLRIDADSVGAEFFKWRDNAGQVRGLSQLLQFFFCDHVQELIKQDEKYRWLYPVYGGGDDLFVIGPWNAALDFAEKLSTDFIKARGEGVLSFSAGVALSKPKQHILTKSDEAAIALNEHAKKRDGKAAIRVFGETFGWRAYPGVLLLARNVTDWYERDLVSSQFLQLLLELHGAWRVAVKQKDEAGQVRHRPILHYQAERNLSKPDQKPVKDWLEKMLRREVADPEASWAAVGFAARYAMLAAKKKKEDGDEQL